VFLAARLLSSMLRDTRNQGGTRLGGLEDQRYIGGWAITFVVLVRGTHGGETASPWMRKRRVMGEGIWTGKLTGRRAGRFVCDVRLLADGLKADG